MAELTTAYSLHAGAETPKPLPHKPLSGKGPIPVGAYGTPGPETTRFLQRQQAKATRPQGFWQEFKSPYARPATQLKTLKWMGGGNLVLDALSGRAGLNFDTALNLAAIGSMFIPGLGVIAGAGFAMKALGNFYDAFTGKGFWMNMMAGVMNTVFALPVFKLFKFGGSLVNACKVGGTLNKAGTGFAWGKFCEMSSRMCYGNKATNSLLGMISKARSVGASPDKIGTTLKASEQARNGIWKFLDWFMGGRKTTSAIANTALSPAGNQVTFSGVKQVGSLLTATG